MTPLEDRLRTILHRYGWNGKMVPETALITECTTGDRDEDTVREALNELTHEGILLEVSDHYALAAAERLSLETYRGGDSTPWQFSLVRTDDEIVITQAKGPPEKFDPVVKRLDIQDRTVGETPVKFDHNVTRRVWSENPDEPHVKSHRSEGRVFQLLYRDPAGRHFVQPEDDDIDETDADEYVPTDHPGLTVNATYMRTEEDEDTRYTTEREYRITPELLDAYAAVYALSYHEVNEESYGQAIWEVEDGRAYRLWRASE